VPFNEFFAYKGSMKDAVGTVIYYDRANESYGIDFDDPIAYDHTCEGRGRGGGHNAWVSGDYLEPYEPEQTYDVPALAGLL
jgi:hypothetical protein